MQSSLRFQAAFKTALAITIAYGVALWMDWDKPMWAAFAVAVISLETVGQSLQKGALRLSGTFAAVGVAFLLLALFPQDRWLFILCLSLHLGLCAYMMGGPQRQYFWSVAGFVSVIIALEAGPTPAASFQIGVLRAQENVLGIVTFGLVTILLWPTSSGAALERAAAAVSTKQRALVRAYIEFAADKTKEDAADAARIALSQATAKTASLVASAEVDTYVIWEVRKDWRAYQRDIEAFAEGMERLRHSLPEYDGLELPHLLPGLRSFWTELEWRLEATAVALAGNKPERASLPPDLSIAVEAAGSLRHFDYAALEVLKGRLERLDAITRSMLSAAMAIRGLGPSGVTEAPAVGELRVRSTLDIDRLFAALRVMFMFWLGWLAYVFVPALPGGSAVVIAIGSLGLQVSMMPQLPIAVLLMPAAAGILFAGSIYIILMPELSSYFTLGPLIFIVTFSICYLFWRPEQALGRTFGLSLFAMVAGISNEQSYSFLSVATTALIFPTAFFIILITAYFPIRYSPEASFDRLVRRYVWSADYLLSSMQWADGRPPTPLHRWRRNFHLNDLAALPGKLRIWAPALSPEAASADSRARIMAFIDELEELSHRLRDLVGVRTRPQAAIALQALVPDVRMWRKALQRQVRALPNPWHRAENASAEMLGIVTTLESKVEAMLDAANDSDIPAEEGRNLYRVLGAYREVAAAASAAAERAARLDWPRLREERF